MKKVLKIVGIIILAVIAVAAIALGIFWYRNILWYDKYEKALRKVGAKEKQATLPGGSVINYGEVKNDKPALLLIHGQMGSWEDYALAMTELSKKWHIYAIDVYGHGESTHDESLYYLDVNGDDLIWFIDHIIWSLQLYPAIQCAITAAYIAAYGGKNVAGAVLKTHRFFDRRRMEESFAYLTL
jgi:pimeloyl-ACP methyl ester carboxylesterase